MKVVAIDIGGTTTKSALLDSASLLEINVNRTPTPQSDPTGKSLAHLVTEIVENWQAKTKVDAVGLVTPGLLDENNGIVKIAGNFGFRDVPLVKLVAEKIELPIAFGHDVRAGALAESRLGASKGVTNSVFIPLGTGIAAAFVIDGKVRQGEGHIGEIGHANVFGPLTCVCGRKGCLEANASAAAISLRYFQATGEKVSTDQVAQLAREKDPVASAIWADITEYLAIGIEWVCNILGPEMIVIGGGLVGAKDLMIEPLTNELTARLTFQRVPRIVGAELGENAGCLGAGLMALDLAGDS